MTDSKKKVTFVVQPQEIEIFQPHGIWKRTQSLRGDHNPEQNFYYSLLGLWEENPINLYQDSWKCEIQKNLCCFKIQVFVNLLGSKRTWETMSPLRIQDSPLGFVFSVKNFRIVFISGSSKISQWYSLIQLHFAGQLTFFFNIEMFRP